MSEKLPETAIDLFKYKIDVQMERGISLRRRTFTLTGEVNQDMFHRVDGCLNIFEEENNRTITIKLCSEGGEIYAALAIIGRIKASPCKIRIEAYGQIMSAATAIFAVGDERIASKYTSFMFHQTSIVMAESKLRDLKHEIVQAERDDQQFNLILEEHTTQDVNFWKLLIGNGQNIYLTADRCFELGLVDKVI